MASQAPRLTTSNELVEYINNAANSDSMCAAAVTAFVGDVNAFGGLLGHTPLIAAVDMARRDTIIALSARDDVDANRKSKYGWSPLGCAAYYNNRMVGLLLETFPSIDVNHVSSWDGTTALHLTAQKGSDVDVGVLLARGANTIIKDKYGRTAEDTARLHAHHSVADMLRQVRLCGSFCPVSLPNSV